MASWGERLTRIGADITDVKRAVIVVSLPNNSVAQAVICTGMSGFALNMILSHFLPFQSPDVSQRFSDENRRITVKIIK